MIRFLTVKDIMYETSRNSSQESLIYNDLKVNFATYKNILRRLLNTSKVYYFKRYKNNIGKIYKLINKTIKSKQIDEVSNEFRIGDKFIDDYKQLVMVVILTFVMLVKIWLII